MQYLTLIRAITPLHQYQCKRKTIDHHGQRIEYIEATLAGIEMANQLAHAVLGRTLDELAPQTRKLLGHIYEMVTQHCQAHEIARQEHRFSRRDIREFTGWDNTQLKAHLKRLEEMEYLLVHRGGRGQSFIYELLYNGEGRGGEAFLSGLIEPEALNYDAKKSGVEAQQSG